MPDYKILYTKLFNKVSDVIEELQQIQCQTEEMYIQGKDAKIVELEPANDKKLPSQK